MLTNSHRLRIATCQGEWPRGQRCR